MECGFRSSIPEPSIRNSCSSDRSHRLQNKQPPCSSRKTSLRPAFCCYSFRGVHTFLSSPFCRHAFSRLERPLTQTRNRPEEHFQQRLSSALSTLCSHSATLHAVWRACRPD